ncbi:hypothetical protein, partial [Pseudomonas prosekii]|uniref:hypothetical protein n=2 Tax=Pseudomonas prosekii TaxID=1148509 RepID=UPI0021CD10F4
TSLISRGVTCDADNLVDYQSDSTSTHTNCLIQLLKSGWLRSFVSTEARILQQRQLLSSGYFQKFSKISSTTSTTCAFDLSLAGGEFYSVTRCCQPLFFNPLSRFDELKQLTAETCVTHCLPRSFPFRLRRKWGEL